MELQIQNASRWKAYCNVVNQLRARNYFVSEKFNCHHLHAQQFAADKLDPDNQEPFILKNQTIVASTISPEIITEDLIKHTENIVLPHINQAIESVFKEEGNFKKFLEAAKLTDNEIPELNINFFFDDVNKRNILQIGETCFPLMREDEVLVLFVRKFNGATNKEGMMQILKYRQLLNCKKLILIMDNFSDSSKFIVSSAPLKKILKFYQSSTKENDFVSIEYFSMSEKKYDPTRTQLHGQFEKYDSQSKEKWLEDNHLKEDQMETIGMDDALRKYYNYKLKDFIEIKESNGCSRFVVIGVNK